MAIEITADKAVCTRCGTTYSKRPGFFPVSYAPSHKGIGYVPVCKQCLEKMYNSYLAQCDDPAKAVRQICRKLDLFWSDSLFEQTAQKSSPRNIVLQYLMKLTSRTYAGKCYDDTLSNEGTLWSFGLPNKERQVASDMELPNDVVPDIDVPEEVKKFWGPGYSPATYAALEERYRYFVNQLPEGVDVKDMGTSTLIRQICGLELDIARDREAGKAVDKATNVLQGLLGSANLKPAQQKDASADNDLASTPLGVWLYRYESKRPLPEAEDDLKDTNKILKYVFVWLGHVCKMLGKKNGFSKLYEQEVSRLRIERPDIDVDDDEEFVSDVLEDTFLGDTSEKDGDDDDS